MQLVERHLIQQGDARYAIIDAACFASKNLYNLANYHIRQVFIQTGKYLSYGEVFHLVKQTDAYKALPAKVTLPFFTGMPMKKEKRCFLPMSQDGDTYTAHKDGDIHTQ